jgi:hypothetical protein
MNQPAAPATPDEKIVRHAHAWRQADKEAIANKDSEARRAEYAARQQLRKVIDEAGQP